jgi:fructosamine-3-kinase
LLAKALAHKLAARFGSPVAHSTPAAGGDINQVHHVRLQDGRELLVKTQSALLPGLFSDEARGLAWLAQAQALRVPEVLFASEADEQGPACLVLEWIERAARARDYAEQLGVGLARLHRTGAPSFGLDHDNYLASLRQHNRPEVRWGTFYAERRIAPLVERAAQRGELPASLRRRLEQLLLRIPGMVGPEEPPARLHGDLWSGNVLCDVKGLPVLIDPAVYGGHREIDLAMMRLFGGFSEAVYAAYSDAFALSPGHTDRVPLYQLYPLLAHVNLFGSAYLAQLSECIAPWV